MLTLPLVDSAQRSVKRVSHTGGKWAQQGRNRGHKKVGSK